MSDYLVTEQIKKKFRYLVDEYGFSVANELYTPDIFGNGLVEYHSDFVNIAVVLDRGQLQVDISPYPNPSNYSSFGLPSIIENIAPESGETDYVYPEKLEDYRSSIDWQIDRLADLLQRYCVPVLRAEFSNWEQMDQQRQKRALKEYKTLTGKVPTKIDSDELQDAIQKEIDRRVAKRKHSASSQKEETETIPWWAFWRRQ